MKEPDNIFFIARLREFLLLQNLQFMHAYKKKKRNRNKKNKIKDKSS
jgi:transposase